MVSVILLSGWKWTRFWSDKCKTLLAGRPVFLYSLETFHNHPKITEIIIVTKKHEISEYKSLKNQFPKIKFVVEWWTERQFSVQNWIQKSTKKITLIHNSANPLVTPKEITDTIKATQKYGSAVVWQKAVNTLKKVDQNWLIIQTIPRSDIYEVQTPQWVNTKIFKKLIKNPNTELFTDDVSFFEHAKLQSKIVPVSKQNFKITYPEDINKAESFLNPKIKIWIGHDSHRIDKNKTFTTLGWIQIKCGFWLEWNSDADVLIHAICNAIGTAIGQGSLSIYSDPMCHQKKITDSQTYLKHIFQEAKKQNYQIWNLACTIEAQKPKLEKHIPAMKQNLAKLLNCSIIQIGIACTSWENLSDFWKWLWIQCFTEVILYQKTKQV